MVFPSDISLHDWINGVAHEYNFEWCYNPYTDNYTIRSVIPLPALAKERLIFMLGYEHVIIEDNS